MRRRVGDKRVLALVKSFLKAGVLGEDGVNRDTFTGTPQGGILSPLLANIALTSIDDHFDARWATHRNASARARHRQRGGATYRLVRYADDFVVMVHGAREHAEELSGEIADVLAPLGLRMAPEKTRVVHIDEGFDFLGFRIQRRNQRGSTKRYVYTLPSKRSVTEIRHKIKTITAQISHQPADVVFKRLNSAVRGWAQYFRYSSASRTFNSLHNYLWWRVWSWATHKHPLRPRRWIWVRYNRRRWPEYNGVRLFDPARMHIRRHPYRGSKIPNPWNTKAVPT
jgi:RNA-directed DNA polymerase